MDRETLAARAFGRPRVALDPDSKSALDLRHPGEATQAKVEGFGTAAVVAFAQEAYFQTEALIGIWTQLERIAQALERPTPPYRTGDPE